MLRRQPTAVIGYIIEGDKPGYLYNRLGQWHQYTNLLKSIVTPQRIDTPAGERTT